MSELLFDSMLKLNNNIWIIMFEPRLVPTIRKRVASSDGDDIESNLRRIDVNYGNNHALKQCNNLK